MYKVKIYNTDYNVSKQVYYHIEGILAENRVLSSEIRAHEDTEKRLREDIDTYLYYFYTLKQNFYQGTQHFL